MICVVTKLQAFRRKRPVIFLSVGLPALFCSLIVQSIASNHLGSPVFYWATTVAIGMVGLFLIFQFICAWFQIFGRPAVCLENLLADLFD